MCPEQGRNKVVKGLFSWIRDQIIRVVDDLIMRITYLIPALLDLQGNLELSNYYVWVD
jgi:hypothetical protein